MSFLLPYCPRLGWETYTPAQWPLPSRPIHAPPPTGQPDGPPIQFESPGPHERRVGHPQPTWIRGSMIIDALALTRPQRADFLRFPGTARLSTLGTVRAWRPG